MRSRLLRELRQRQANHRLCVACERHRLHRYIFSVTLSVCLEHGIQITKEHSGDSPIALYRDGRRTGMLDLEISAAMPMIMCRPLYCCSLLFLTVKHIFDISFTPSSEDHKLRLSSVVFTLLTSHADQSPEIPHSETDHPSRQSRRGQSPAASLPYFGSQECNYSMRHCVCLLYMFPRLELT